MKTSQLNDLKTQVKTDINNIEGVDTYMFNWIVESVNLEYKVSISYKVAYTEKTLYTNKGALCMNPEFEKE